MVCAATNPPPTGQPSSTRSIVSVRLRYCASTSPKYTRPNSGTSKACPTGVTPGQLIFTSFTSEHKNTPQGSTGTFGCVVTKGSAAILRNPLSRSKTFFSVLKVLLLTNSSSSNPRSTGQPLIFRLSILLPRRVIWGSSCLSFSSKLWCEASRATTRSAVTTSNFNDTATTEVTSVV